MSSTPYLQAMPWPTRLRMKRDATRIPETMKTHLLEMVTMVASGLMVAATTDTVMPEDRLIAYCVSGGLFAAMASVCFFPPDTHRKAAAMFGGNAIVAGMTGPYATDWFCARVEQPVSLRAALMVTCGIGLFGMWFIVQVLAPTLSKCAPEWLNSKLGIKPGSGQ